MENKETLFTFQPLVKEMAEKFDMDNSSVLGDLVEKDGKVVFEPNHSGKWRITPYFKKPSP